MKVSLQRRGFFLFLLLALQYLSLQAQPFHFQLFDTQDGLYSPDITALYQDSKGRLWIGTAVGASVYDGYTFQNITQADGLPGGKVKDIAEDIYGAIWIATEKGLGVVRDKSIRRWGKEDGLLSEQIDKLYMDSEGNLWLGTWYELSLFSKEKIAAFHQDELQPPFFQHFKDDRFQIEVYDLAGDGRGNIYVGVYTGLLRFNIETARFHLIAETGEERAMPEAIVPLGRDSVLWGVYDGNIYLYANGVLDTVFLSPFTINENEGFVLENDLWGVRDHRMLEYVNGKPDTSFLLTETREMLFQDNAFWVQYGGGLSRITQEGVNTYATPSEWKLRYFTCMLRDREGNFWLGSTEGLIKVFDQKFRFYVCEDGLTKDLYSLEEDSNGRLIIGGNQGRVFVYEKEDHFISYQPSTVLPAGEIYDIQRDYRGNLWFASYWQGIAREKDGAITRYFCRDENDSCMDIYCLYEDRQKDIWAGTWVGMTRLIMDAEADTVRKIIHYWENDNLQFTAKCVVQDNYGTLWFGADEGLFYLDRDSIRVYASLPFQTGIEALKVDKRNNLWAATQGVGILHFKIKDGRKLELLNRFTTDNGLASNFFLDLELDEADNVWAATYMGISLLKKTNEDYHIVNYNEKDGLIDKAYSRLKLYKDGKNRIWGASPMGVFSFEPKEMTMQSQVLETQLIKVLFSGKELDSLPVISSIKLPWNRNTFETEFKAINLSNPLKTQYRYRLQGYEEDWSLPVDVRYVRYNNLDPGVYTFQVKASNADGFWNEQPTTFSFTIKPPFWQTWWFIGGGVMLIGAISVIYVRDRENRLRKEEAEKSRVNQLIAELETRALRAQMNPHFIFNSLNAIQEAILSKEFNTAYAYLFKFSKLLRQVLYSSSKGSIPVETEVEMLNLYLELESLRFDDSFQYKIEVAPDDEVEDVMIPSLMIQPFVENAIWHGLLPKVSDRLLNIRFFTENESLICTVKDNGIGREKTALVQKGKKLKHQPMAMNLIRERLAIIRERTGKKADYFVSDLKDKAGEACGTLVTLCLPADWDSF